MEKYQDFPGEANPVVMMLSGDCSTELKGKASFKWTNIGFGNFLLLKLLLPHHSYLERTALIERIE